MSLVDDTGMVQSNEMKATFTVELVDLEEFLAEAPGGPEEGGRLLAASGGEGPPENSPMHTTSFVNIIRS